jgi:large subunit ribosomal protein L15
MKLNDLKPNLPKKNRKRMGHGISAGQGKTAGRGTKGQNSRTGSGGHLYRQGGALPFFRRLPFVRGKGFTPPTEVTFNEINLDQLSSFKTNAEVTPVTLDQARLIRDPRNPVAIMGRGELKTALKVRVHRVTKSARAKIEAAGGSVDLIG